MLRRTGYGFDPRTAFHQRDANGLCLSADAEFGAYVDDAVVACRDNKGPVGIMRDLEKRLAPVEPDMPLSICRGNTQRRIGVQLDDRAVRQGDALMASNLGREGLRCRRSQE